MSSRTPHSYKLLIIYDHLSFLCSRCSNAPLVFRKKEETYECKCLKRLDTD